MASRRVWIRQLIPKYVASDNVHKTPKLWVMSVHYQSEFWLKVQRRFLDEYLDLPHERIFAALGIPLEAFESNEIVVTYDGKHSSGLDGLAKRALELAEDSDWLLFLDSDAFPINPISHIIDGCHYPINAVQRLENAGDVQPHPSFCLARVSAFRDLGSRWESNYFWRDAFGKRRTDVGSGILQALEEKAIDWGKLRRINRREFHPLFFGVYGIPGGIPAVYHHGAGSRASGNRIEKYMRARRPLRFRLQQIRYRLGLFFLIRDRASRRLESLIRDPRIVANDWLRSQMAKDINFYEVLLS